MSQPPPPSGFNNGLDPGAYDPPAPYSFNTNIMAGAIIVLILVIFFILMLHLYAKWFLGRSAQSYIISRRIATSSAQNNPGLDKATIAQLPTFVYTASSPPVDNLEAGKSDDPDAPPSTLECSVCLSEFQENEKGRILPACKHVFHTECIDMWLLTHSTCPLCRTDVMPAPETSAETASTDQQHQQQEAMELAAGVTEGNSGTSHTVEYPSNILFWGNQTQVVSSQEPSTSSLPVSSSLSSTHGARALPQITIDIPSIEGNVVPGASGHLSTKSTTEQDAGSSHPLKSPGFRASIKRMLSRQSSRHKSSSQEGNEESPK